jgi:hypothetical protein
MNKETLEVSINGRVQINDSIDGVILDKRNAVHPQNIARIFARGLANEPNSHIYTIAFGNGGTFVDATGTVSFRTPNDGIFPDTTGTGSRLYNETYREIIDDRSPLLGQGPNAFPGGDGGGTGVRSSSIPGAGTGSQVVITAVLNGNEPIPQQNSSLSSSSLNADFVFDELGLFSPGLPPIATQGYQDVVVGGKSSTDRTGLEPGEYFIRIEIDGQRKEIPVPVGAGPAGGDGSITYGALASLVNERITTAATNGQIPPLPATPGGAAMQVTQPGINTFGRLRFISNTSGGGSTIALILPSALSSLVYNTRIDGSPSQTGDPIKPCLLTSLGTKDGGTQHIEELLPAVPGSDSGEDDNSANPSAEKERLLTHLIFSPLLKAKDRTWTITYTLTITIKRTGT